ncbi:MAG: hypothetical protein KDM91_15475, partial [Verrucomicrobiae bacterium]|nr:hypothetical protein [Verrucomicrobiae bacterium]
MKFPPLSAFSVPTAPIAVGVAFLILSGASAFAQTAPAARQIDPENPPADLVELAWAYAISTEKPPPMAEDNEKHSLPGTPLTFTRDEILGRVDGVSFQGPPADWYPGDHPKMP